MLEPEDRTEDLVKSDHRSDFKAKQSIAQMPRKTAGTCRLVATFHFDIPPESLKVWGKEHGTVYTDGVDFGRALLKWLQAEGKTPELDVADVAAKLVQFEVAK